MALITEVAYLSRDNQNRFILKADGVASRLMGFEPEDIGYLYYLNGEGLGNYSIDGLCGERISSVARNFAHHPTYEIQRQWRKTV